MKIQCMQVVHEVSPSATMATARLQSPRRSGLWPSSRGCVSVSVGRTAMIGDAPWSAKILPTVDKADGISPHCYIFVRGATLDFLLFSEWRL